jgi:hypothetical protein
MRKALFLILPILLMSILIPFVGAPPNTETVPIHQVQLQCRRWDPPGWRYWYWNYDTEIEMIFCGKTIHTEITYQPAVSEEEGTSMKWVYDKDEGVYILHEGTVKYLSPYSGLWITEYWKGYLRFDSNGDFEHGVAYQWGYHYGSDPTGYYTHAIFDETMDAWLLGFSIYIWDPDDFDQQTEYFQFDGTEWVPNQAYVQIEPVPKDDYNPLGL